MSISTLNNHLMLFGNLTLDRLLYLVVWPLLLSSPLPSNLPAMPASLLVFQQGQVVIWFHSFRHPVCFVLHLHSSAFRTGFPWNCLSNVQRSCSCRFKIVSNVHERERKGRNADDGYEFSKLIFSITYTAQNV